MRARGVHGPIQAAARFSASLHRVGGTVFDRPFADSVEAVFIFVAFRRFPHFSDNQQERTHSCNEKPYGYDHDQGLSMICAIINRFPISFVPIHAFVLFNRGIYYGNADTNERARASKSFRRVCPAVFLSARSVRFWTVLSNPETPDRGTAASSSRNAVRTVIEAYGRKGDFKEP